MQLTGALLVLVLAGTASLLRVKRHLSAAEDEVLQALCKDKDPGEWFRLISGVNNCSLAVQCTSAGLERVECPDGLYFDLSKQMCEWDWAEPEETEQSFLVKSLLHSSGWYCNSSSEQACDDGICIDKFLFCDGKPDCRDSSDESLCDWEHDPNCAPLCDPSTCQLPYCFCSESGKVVPGDLKPEQVPQMITISFNGAINSSNMDLFDELFSQDSRLNPNGCPMKGTFFVSHKYTNYTAVQDLHSRGHEIAVFSVTQNDTAGFWTNASEEEWSQEMNGQRSIIEKFAGIVDKSVVGMRTPGLQVGGKNQFFMTDEQKFLYDSTIIAPLSDIPFWPYDLLFKVPHLCQGNAQKCPTQPHFALEMVMNELDRPKDIHIDDNLPGCAQVDSCSKILNGEQFNDFLNHNFDRHFLTNRAPLSLNFDLAWLKKGDHLGHLITWIAYIESLLINVYFVTMTQVIEWMKHPRNDDETRHFEAWLTKCEAPLGFECEKPGGFNCALHSDAAQGTFNMQTCQRCPPNYPWLNDPTGLGYL